MPGLKALQFSSPLLLLFLLRHLMTTLKRDNFAACSRELKANTSFLLSATASRL